MDNTSRRLDLSSTRRGRLQNHTKATKPKEQKTRKKIKGMDLGTSKWRHLLENTSVNTTGGEIDTKKHPVPSKGGLKRGNNGQRKGKESLETLKEHVRSSVCRMSWGAEEITTICSHKAAQEKEGKSS